MLIQVLMAALATVSFSVLFNVPAREYVFCGITGAIGWLFYLITCSMLGSIAFANFIAAIIITVVSRLFAVNRRVPVTIFLIAGIFPLVPGAGIYYTTSHIFNNEVNLAAAKGIETISIAICIAFGIMVVFLIPQKLFMIGKRKGKA
ncbi:MAG TPA: threonine/serine exporter [Clostridiales bacterium]|nr:threonine/serine exporter [Clostridiales bacterium]